MQSIECQLLRRSTGGLTIIFIHGILGSALTWQNPDTNAYWPRLVFDDPEFEDYGLYIFNYRADAFAGAYSLEDVAGKLAENIAELFAGERGLVFVGHSMGGIVARAYVANNELELHRSRKKIGVFLVASPSAGSFYANIVAWISPFYNSQLKTLRSGQSNEWLSSVDRRFLKLVHSRDVDIVGKELVEDNAPNLLKYIFQLAQIVPPATAAKYFPDSLRIAFSDHSSIARPANKGADQHQALRRFLTLFRNRSRETPMVPQSADTTSPQDARPQNAAQTIVWPSLPRRKPAVVLMALIVGAVAALFWRHIYYPTIDLNRTIDFTRLQCDGQGNKNDVVTIDDAYSVVFNLFRFENYSKRADFMRDNYQAHMFDLNKARDTPVPGKTARDSVSENRASDHDLSVVDSKMAARWVWRDSHGGNEEGTAITGGWNLRNLSINYKLPPQKSVKEIKRIIPEVAARECRPAPEAIVCPGLYTREKVQITWDWDVWENCKK